MHSVANWELDPINTYKQRKEQQQRCSSMDANCRSSISPLSSPDLRGVMASEPNDEDSDAATCDVSGLDGDECEEEVFSEERVRMKIQVLAMMVGIGGCSEPAAVLAEVVKVLRELDDRAKKGVFLLSG